MTSPQLTNHSCKRMWILELRVPKLHLPYILTSERCWVGGFRSYSTIQQVYRIYTSPLIRVKVIKLLKWMVNGCCRDPELSSHQWNIQSVWSCLYSHCRWEASEGSCPFHCASNSYDTYGGFDRGRIVNLFLLKLSICIDSSTTQKTMVLLPGFTVSELIHACVTSHHTYQF